MLTLGGRPNFNVNIRGKISRSTARRALPPSLAQGPAWTGRRVGTWALSHLGAEPGLSGRRRSSPCRGPLHWEQPLGHAWTGATRRHPAMV